MKWTLTLLVILITSSAFSQTPEKISYQAIIRNNDNSIANEKEVSLKIVIKQGTISGQSVYEETHKATTNAGGLVTLEIGTGSPTVGNFTTIDWANGPYFTETQLDMSGGSNYEVIGVSQLLSVPYALHAKTAESLIGGGGASGRAKIISFITSRNIAATDINNTIECTANATLILPVGFSEMNVGDTINLEAHNGATLTIQAASGVTLNYTDAASATFVSTSGVVRFGLLRKTGANNYIISGQ